MFKSGDRTQIVFVVTIPDTMLFYCGQIQYLTAAGFDVAVICSPGWSNVPVVQYYPIIMEREISPLRDLISLIRITVVLMKLKPDIICYGTPKASLLAGIAAFLIRVPVRIYMCLGLRLETTQGWKRKILTVIERIISACSSRVWCISQSIKERLLQLGLADPQKLDIIGFGSVQGVNLKKFHPHPSAEQRKNLMDAHSIPPGASIIGFIGRLTIDKGIPEAVQAFGELKKSFNPIYLILVGSFEENNPLPQNTLERIYSDSRIVLTGFVSDVPSYLHIFDLLWLPSHREGMGDVLLEAAASGIPVVACQTTGITDVVDDGVTGYLVPVGDSRSLAAYTKKILLDKFLARKMGEAARRRIEQRFNQSEVWENMKLYYQHLLSHPQERFDQKPQA